MNINRIIMIFLSLVMFTNCDRQELPEYIGPALCASDKFVLLSPLAVNKSSVNFKTGDKALITATFNETIPWILTVKGAVSGSVKTFSGYSDAINIRWIGNADAELSFFRNELCTVELLPSCKEAISTSFSMTANDFLSDGYLCSDFDGNGSTTFSNPPYGANADGANSGIKNTPVAASLQGGNYYRITSLPGLATPTWFFGGTSCSFHKFNDFENDLTGNAALASAVKDPSKLYFNVFLSSNGVPNSSAAFTFVEFVGSSQVQRKYVVNIDWQGWKMISFKLSDAGVAVPANLTLLDIGCGAAFVQDVKGEIVFDFPIITGEKSFNEL